MLDDGDLQATVTSSDSGLYYSHGTAMLMWLVGNGKGWDGSQGVPGLVPKADVMFVTAGRGTVLMSAEDCQNLARQQVGPDLMSMVDWGARVINMSNNGYMEAKSYEGMLDALRHGVIIVSGRSNDKETDAVVNGSSTDVMTGDPRSWDSFPGVIRNNEVGPDGNIAGISDVADANVNILSPGDQVLMSTYDKSRDMSVDTGGTSTGSAVLSGYLALVVQKWPDATGNQILQSLVRNTKGNDSGEAKLDPGHKRGYGQVDPGRLLTVDPTQYPDVNPILEAQVTAAAKLSDDRSKWYAQDCSKNPDGVGDVLDDSLPVPCQAGEIGREYERQKAAWKKVEQCKSDGGSDCMRYSATATADKAGGKAVLPDTGDGRDGVKSSGVPVWVWLAAGGVGVAVVAGGIVLAVVLSKRGRRRSRHGGHASGRGPLPPANPYPPQVPGANNGMVPPPAAVQYVPQQQAPHSSAFPRQTPYPAVPYPVPPQQAAQPPVIPGNIQNPYTNNNHNNR
ncbi:S8/S53 family peptidase [Bifidobacterium bifidum]|uniref:S8/S53 family peptidase n=1 Tax=Bifidobacterium bifidum TaxID=1681 RepID=UPI0032DE912B